jgi:hypothetical protein
MDQHKADATLRSDLSALSSIWDDKLIAYSTAALYGINPVLLDYTPSESWPDRAHRLVKPARLAGSPDNTVDAVN